MKQAQLDNCRICGQLFVNDRTDYCLSCYRDIEKDFKRVTNFLRNERNRYATLEEVSDAVDVPIKRITDFIRGGRIFAEDYPRLGYECAQCGTLIKRQVLCGFCFDQYNKDVQQMLIREKAADEIRKQRQQQPSEMQYWRLKKK